MEVVKPAAGCGEQGLEAMANKAKAVSWSVKIWISSGASVLHTIASGVSRRIAIAAGELHRFITLRC